MRIADKTKEQLVGELEALRLRIAELEDTEAERKRREEALRTIEEEKLAILNTMSEHVVYQNRQHRILWANKAAAQSAGLTREQLVGCYCYETWPQRNKPCVGCPVVKARESGKLQEGEIITPDGRVWFIQAYPIRDVNDRVVGIVEVMLEITESKQAQEALQAEQNKLQSVVDAIEYGLSIQDKDYNIIYQNEPLRTIFGDRAGEKCYRVYEGKDKVCDGCPVEMAFKDGKSHTSERRVVMPSGEVAFWENTANPVRDARGRIVSCLEITRNITERKRMEEALQQSREELRKMLESVTDGIIVVDLNGVITEVNQRTVEMHGFGSKDKLLGKSALELVAPCDHERVADNMRQALKQGTVRGVEYTLLKADGSEFPGELSTSVLKDASGKAIGHITISRDITERKQVEEALLKGEKKYKLLFESTLDGMLVLDAETMKVVLANQAAADIYGLNSVEEVVGLNPLDSVPPEERERVLRIIVKDMFENDLRQVNEFRTITKDGREMWISAVGTRTEYQGKLAGLISFSDITERRHMEEALRQRQEELQKMFESVTDGILVIDLNGVITEVNQRTAEMHGFNSRDELLGKSALELVAPCDHERIATNMRKALKQGAVRGVEYTMLKADGSEFPGELSSNALKDASGNPVGHITIERDITERKQAGEELERQKAYFQQLFDNSPEGIALLDDADRVVQVNKGFETLFGYQTEETKGRFINDIVVPEDRFEEAAALSRATLNGGVRRKETVRKRKGGSLVDVSTLGYPIRFGGKTVGVYAIYSDITERKRAEEELERQEAYFQQLFDNSPEGIALLDDADRVVQVNKGFETLFGYQTEETKGRFLNDIVVPEDRFEEATAMSQAVLNNKVGRKETVRKRKDGSLVDVSTLGYPIRFGGKTVGVYAIYSDITERKQAEEEKKEMEQKAHLASRLASVGEMASGIAHEINNPLTSVIGFSQLLMEGDIPADIKEDVSIIYKEAQRAAGVAKNLLTFARKQAPAKQSTNMNSIIDGVLKLRAYEHRVNNIQVDSQLAPDLPEVMADYSQLQQVFINIIINAESAMIEAHRGGNLTITTQRVNNSVRASFTDDGPGIAKENLNRIFDPFFTTKEVGKGTGLGLSVCHGIVAEHGGRMYARSKLGKGATFVVELPVNNS